MPTSSPYRKDRLSHTLKECAAKFIEEESSRTSLITVTNIHLSKDNKSAIIFFTVYPENQEETVLSFVKRQRSHFKDYLRKHSGLMRLPSVDFRLDSGEKNRQRLDELATE